MKRHSKFTINAQRLTPTEVALLWFRRGREFAREINEEYPDFPPPGPDGLYLLTDVKAWFDGYHGKTAISAMSGPMAEEEMAMRIARGC